MGLIKYNGFLYSRKPFHRFKFEATFYLFKDGTFVEPIVIYTNNPSDEDVTKFINSMKAGAFHRELKLESFYDKNAIKFRNMLLDNLLDAI